MSSTIRVQRALPTLARDGTLLATDVYLPPGDGPFPTLIYRVRGGRTSAFIAGVLLVNPFDAVERGYAVVIQEVRGRAESADRWQPFVHERNDSEDCLDWVLAQPWCDGRIGAYGTAYSAVGALQLAGLGRPEVKAIAVLGTGADYHDGWIYTSGAFELGWNIYWAYMTLKESISRLDTDDERRAELAALQSQAIVNANEVAARLPLRDHPLLLEVGDTQFHEWLDHPDYDDFWQQIDVLDVTDKICAPMLSFVGWWDNFLSSHFDLYRAVTTRGQEPGRSHHRLIVGPWEHCNYVTSVLSTNRTGDVEFGTVSMAGVAVSGPLVLDWFDRWVRELDAGAADGIRYWQIGTDEWREVTAWPPPHDEVRWYLHSGGSAASALGDGTLDTDAPAEVEPTDQFSYDPAEPVPTVGGKTLMPTIAAAGIVDRRDVEQRQDVLCYTSDALANPVEIAGRVRVELFASSSAPDTDFVAHLVDVAPDGTCVSVADGIVRARYRESVRTRSGPLTPGETNLFTIDLWDIACTFRTGHRIRLEVTSSDFPRFDRNLNIELAEDAPFGIQSLDEAAIAHQVICHSHDTPSCVVLPVSRR